MKLLRPSNAPENTKILMTTAENGATFSSVDKASGQYYRELLAQEELADIVTLRQVHGTVVLPLTFDNINEVRGAEADGIFTAEKGLPVAVLTADCYPLILCGKRAVAALHCGWRSAVGGIIDNAMSLFNEYNDMPDYAYIGAGISRRSFEVRADFIDSVSALFDSAPYLHEAAGRSYFDLEKFISERLVAAGVNIIDKAGICTYESESFHSYRRDGAESGRMITAVVRN